jgi:predicted small secreted protein
MMKRVIFSVMCSALLLSSCATYTGQGAYVGASVGSLLGSALGGYSGGWSGHHAGQIVGMATGAAVGAAIGAAEDKKVEERMQQYPASRSRRAASRKQRKQAAKSEAGLDGVYENGAVREPKPATTDSGFDATNGGDDRVDFGISGPSK